jgi:type III secretion protein C
VKKLVLCLLIFLFAYPEEELLLNFNQVKISELIRFVSKIAKVNFIFDESLLTFDVNLVSGKPLNKGELVDMLITILKQNQCSVHERNGIYFIDTKTAPQKEEKPALRLNKAKFEVIKLQYHQGDEILKAIKELCLSKPAIDPVLLQAIQSIQWMKSTNSLLVSVEPDYYSDVVALIESVDTPQKQVFIEVLVLETNIKDGLQFGVDWSLKKKNSPNSPPMTIGRGIDLGIIGDMILHKGFSFYSIGALVSAVEQDSSAQIVLNQKIITQDNQNSKIFVGDTIPFAGSKTEILGASSQTTSSIEYKDVGVSLSITPLIGDQDVITLDIAEEITEALPGFQLVNGGFEGLKTTKTHMMTKAHVPDQHFLILTGMIRNKQIKHRSFIPCLGAIPYIGALFGNMDQTHEKRHITIFVRPQIIKNVKMMQSYTMEEMEKAKN